MATPNPFDLFLEQVRQAAEEGAERGVKRALLSAADGQDKKPPPSEWVRAAELAQRFNLPKSYFEEKGRLGLIKRSKPGRYVLFSMPDVERFLREKSH